MMNSEVIYHNLEYCYRNNSFPGWGKHWLYLPEVQGRGDIKECGEGSE